MNIAIIFAGGSGVRMGAGIPKQFLEINGKPIIILTAYDWSGIEEEAKEAGVTGFCSKPIFMSELRDILSKPYLGQQTDNFSAEREKEE